MTQTSAPPFSGAVPAIAPAERAARLAAHRPKIDIEQVRASWKRAEDLFKAIQRQDYPGIARHYLPGARVVNPLIGQIEGEDIARVWQTVTERTSDFALDFAVCCAEAQSARIEWSTRHVFFDTDRIVELSGETFLSFERDKISMQRDEFDLRRWTRQAMGLSGLALSFVPGWRGFIRNEARRVLGVASDA